jgi:hypothetical protein
MKRPTLVVVGPDATRLRKILASAEWELVGSRDAALAAGVHMVTLRAWARAHTPGKLLPRRRVGMMNLYSPADIRRFRGIPEPVRELSA